MDYINHINLNTGHKRLSYLEDFNTTYLFEMNRIYKDSLRKRGTKIRDGYTVRSTLNPYHGLLVTIYNPDGLPVLTVGITDNSNSKVWNTLHETSYSVLATEIEKPPEAPYIAERLEIGAGIDPETLTWVVDFTRYIGWIYLAPRAVIKYA